MAQANLIQNNPQVGTYTQKELAAFVNASASNLISWCIVRNPTAVYNWLLMNYPEFGRMGNQGWTTPIGQDNMHDFMLNQYDILGPKNQQAFITSLTLSLPDKEETQSWATPKA